MTGTYNLTLNEGEDFSIVFTWTTGSPAAPVNLTGWSAHMQVRTGFADQNGAVLLDLSSANGKITLGGAAGTITVAIAAANTTGLGFTSAVYDLKMTDGTGRITRLLQGTVTYSLEVTV